MGRRTSVYIVAAAIGTFAAGNAWAQTAGSQQQDPRSASQQGRDEAKSRQSLVQARETLAEVATMPEAAQLQGQARTEVSQLITNFNSLLGADANWYEHYQNAMQNVYNIIGPVTTDEPTSATAGATGSTTGAVGTTGTSGSAGGATASADVPSAIRNKLAQFRQELMEFGRAAGAPDPTGGVSSATSTAGTSGSATGSTARTSGATSTTTGSTTGTTGSTTGTTGSTSGSTTGSTQGTAGSASETVQQHVDAINDILQQALGGSSTGTSGTAGTTGSRAGTGSSTGSATLTREQVDRIQSHLQRIREISRQPR